MVHMLRICISGLSCSGKTSLGDALSKDLNIMHITKHGTSTYKKVKEDTENQKESEVGIIQTADRTYADSFDKEIVKLAEGNNCVVTTWLGPWLIKDATIRVWLSASFEERVRRYANLNKTSIENAKAFIKKKDELSINAFNDIYNIDVKNHSFFDMMINTERLNIKESVAIISMLAIGKEESKFR
jgi:cytidylate kinase